MDRRKLRDGYYETQKNVRYAGRVGLHLCRDVTFSLLFVVKNVFRRAFFSGISTIGVASFLVRQLW